MILKLKNLFLLSLIIWLGACIEVKFRDSQPSGITALEEIPSSLQGKYQNEDGDTLILTSTTFTLLNRKSECNKLSEFDSLTERIRIKEWDGYYFFNMNEDSLWTVGLIEMTEDNSFVFSLIDAEDDEILETISGITKITTHYSEDGEAMVYAVDASHQQLKELIANHTFSTSYYFKRLPVLKPQ